MNEEERRKYEAFQYWIQTNTEKGVTTIPDTLCLFVVNLIKSLQKENEKLKAKLLDTLEGQKVIKEETPQDIKENYISKEEVKDKIEKYKNMCISNVKGYENYFKDNYNELVFRRMELLEKELLDKSIDESNERYQCTQNEKSQTLKLSQIPPPEPQLPTKTLCESFSKKARSNNEII